MNACRWEAMAERKKHPSSNLHLALDTFLTWIFSEKILLPWLIWTCYRNEQGRWTLREIESCKVSALWWPTSSQGVIYWNRRSNVTLDKQQWAPLLSSTPIDMHSLCYSTYHVWDEALQQTSDWRSEDFIYCGIQKNEFITKVHSFD